MKLKEILNNVVEEKTKRVIKHIYEFPILNIGSKDYSNSFKKARYELIHLVISPAVEVTELNSIKYMFQARREAFKKNKKVVKSLCLGEIEPNQAELITFLKVEFEAKRTRTGDYFIECDNTFFYKNLLKNINY